jgi:two-component system chemotaxis sensor kinase CheA
MPPADEQFRKKLLATFSIEAREHVAAITAGLVEFEKAEAGPASAQLVEAIYRESHSLKGAARAVSLTRIEAVCQTLESIFAGLKRQNTKPSAEAFDKIHQMVASIEAELAPAASAPAPADAGQPSAPPPPAKERPALPDTIRIPTSKLTSVWNQAEELILWNAALERRLAGLREVGETLAGWEREWRRARAQIRAHQTPREAPPGAAAAPNGASLDSAGANQASYDAAAVNGASYAAGGVNGASYAAANGASHDDGLLAFLDRNEPVLRSLRSRVGTLASSLRRDTHSLERDAGDLLRDVRRLSMLPFSILLEAFPKLVRDLCRDCDKDARLVISGADIEASRRILEELKDPLIHLVRNSVDHGVEPLPERQRAGKPAQATVTIAIALKSGDQVEIAISDDGAGVDVDRVRQAIVEQERLSAEQVRSLDDRQALQYIFQSGLSTRRQVTAVSGRGLGLAIVRQKVEALGGEIRVESERGNGATFRISAPLSISTLRGILVRDSDQVWVIPTMYVQRVLRLGREQIQSVENRPAVVIGERTHSVAWLSQTLGISAPDRGANRDGKLPGLLVEWAGEQIVFLVEEILYEREVQVKSLGRQLTRVRNIAGATILEDGTIALVLQVADLMRLAPAAAGAAREEQSAAPKSLLVVEDSITARTLLKGILEASGYLVTTAVDGAEAFERLEKGAFDLVVSDVEMPRMSGIELTAKIRATPAFAELPVVLVTALASQEDRERGAEVGANAYIVKSSFDQSNLLEVIQRLI